MLNNMMENEHKSFTNTSIFSGNMLPSSFKTIISERGSNSNLPSFLFTPVGFNMMKLLAKVKAGKTMIKKSHKVTNRLNYRLFYNSYHKRKIKYQLLRLVVLRFRFYKKSDGSTTNTVA